MTIAEAKQKRRALSGDVANLLIAFEKDTGLMVDSIRIDRLDVTNCESHERQTVITKLHLSLRWD